MSGSKQKSPRVIGATVRTVDSFVELRKALDAGSETIGGTRASLKPTAKNVTSRKVFVRGADAEQITQALREVPSEQIAAAHADSEASRRDIPNAPAGAMAHAGANASRPIKGRLPHTARRDYSVSVGDRDLTETQARHHVAKAMREGHISPEEASRCEGHFNLRRQLPRDLAAKLLVASSK